ncbi:MAG: hypothetical protein QOH41_747 [Blastocatellia bacterium]|jgi:hypothetical protein|nr:hypothetical protein [Blastocatellia bacterium]
MTSRENGNLWPVISVAAGAFFVLVIMPLVMHRQQNGQMATVDPQVFIGDMGSDAARDRNALLYRWPNSEVPRTAERLRDVTAVAIASITYVVDNSITGHPPHDAGEILLGIARHELIPNEWLTNQPGVLQMPRGTVHLRYSPSNLSVELVSVPNEPGDGPAILIRIPDGEKVSVGARYFESMQLDGIIYPEPFAPISQIIASGWQPRLFKQTQIADTDRAQIEAWSKTVSRK